MSYKEKQECIERIDQLCPGLVIEFYNKMSEYMKQGAVALAIKK